MVHEPSEHTVEREPSMVGPAMNEPLTAPEDLTSSVLASFERCRNERLREIMRSLVRHLHAFALEVGLTEREWEAAMGVLAETGRITDDRRQEFVLWSDSLGLSVLVDAMANPKPPGATESTFSVRSGARMLPCVRTGQASRRRSRARLPGSTGASWTYRDH